MKHGVWLWDQEISLWSKKNQEDRSEEKDQEDKEKIRTNSKIKKSLRLFNTLFCWRITWQV
jgi:hypothetical protein